MESRTLTKEDRYEQDETETVFSGVQGGVDIYRVKGLLGHRDLRSTSRYAHLSPEHLAAVRVLDEDGGYDSVTLEKAKGA